MHLVVIGAGAAGLTAAHRLQQAGHDVTVLEAAAEVGGRTHSEHFGPGHWADTGAGWLASFYPRALALIDEIGETGRLQPMQLRGGGDLMLDGRVVPFPSSLRRILTSPLLGGPTRPGSSPTWLASSPPSGGSWSSTKATTSRALSTSWHGPAARPPNGSCGR